MKLSASLTCSGLLVLVYGAGLVACSNADLSAGGAKAVGVKSKDGDEDEEDDGEPDAGEGEDTVPPGADAPEWVNGVSLTCEWLAAPADDKAQIGCNLRDAAGNKVKNTTKIGIEWAVYDTAGNKVDADGEDRDDGVTHVFTLPSKDITKLSVGFKLATGGPKQGADGAPAPVKAKLAEKLPGLTYGSALSGCLEVGAKPASECLQEQLAPPPQLANAAQKNVRLFVTSKTYHGGFGPLVNGHRECNVLAQNAKLTGVWRALVSAPNARYVAGDPAGAVSVRTLVADDSHVFDVSGTMLAASAGDLFDGTLAAPLAKDEKGNAVPAGAPVWTGSDLEGRLVDATCSNWSADASSGMIGSVGTVNAEWIAKGSQSCLLSAHLYCIETPQLDGNTDALSVPKQ